jgi:hypothetical protein
MAAKAVVFICSAGASPASDYNRIGASVPLLLFQVYMHYILYRMS